MICQTKIVNIMSPCYINILIFKIGANFRQGNDYNKCIGSHAHVAPPLNNGNYGIQNGNIYVNKPIYVFS